MLGVVPGSAAQGYGTRITRMGEFSVRAFATTGNLIKSSLEKIADQLSDLARHTENLNVGSRENKHARLPRNTARSACRTQNAAAPGGRAQKKNAGADRRRLP